MMSLMLMRAESDCEIQLMLSLSMWLMDLQLLFVQCTNSYFHAACMFSVVGHTYAADLECWCSAANEADDLIGPPWKMTSV